MKSGVNGSTHIASTPRSATSSALRSIEVRIAGWEPGRITSAGCGSNVRSRHGRPIARARSTAAPISFWWPRWTPSYIPMVTTVRPRSVGVASRPRQRCTRSSYRPAEPGRSGNPVQPAVAVGDATVLDVEQRLAQPHRDGPGSSVADGEVAGARLHLADGGDDGCGAAREGLGDRAVGDAAAPLLDAEAPLAHPVAHVLSEGDERVAR